MAYIMDISQSAVSDAALRLLHGIRVDEQAQCTSAAVLVQQSLIVSSTVYTRTHLLRAGNDSVPISV